MNDTTLPPENGEPEPVALPIGRTPDISEEEVINAIKQLEQSGKRPNGYAIKKQLGNRGDTNRYRNILNKYLANRQVTESVPVQELPVEVQEQFNQFSQALNQQLMQMAKAMNHRAVTTAEQRVAAAVQGARQDVEAIRIELQEADQANQDMEQAFAKLQADHLAGIDALKQATEQIKSLVSQQQQQSQTIAVQQEKLTALQGNLNGARDEIAHLGSERDRLANQLNDALEDKKRAQQSAEKWQVKAESYEQERDACLAEKLTAQQSANQSQFKLGQAEKQIETLQQEKEELVKQRESALSDAAELRGRVNTLKEQLDSLAVGKEGDATAKKT